jgi:hypothetical protein
MDGGNEHRVALKFGFKAGISATEKLVWFNGGMGIRL